MKRGLGWEMWLGKVGHCERSPKVPVPPLPQTSGVTRAWVSLSVKRGCHYSGDLAVMGISGREGEGLMLTKVASWTYPDSNSFC